MVRRVDEELGISLRLVFCFNARLFPVHSAYLMFWTRWFRYSVWAKLVRSSSYGLSGL